MNISRGFTDAAPRSKEACHKLAYVAIVRGVGLLGADAVHGWDTDVLALFHRAVLELHPLQDVA